MYTKPIFDFIFQFQPVLAGSFQFSLTPRSYSCDILEEAFARYRTIIKHLEKSPENDLG